MGSSEPEVISITLSGGFLMARKLAPVIFLFCIFVSTAYGDVVSVEARTKLEQFMRRIIIQRMTHTIKKNTSATSFEIDLTSFKISSADKILDGTDTDYQIKGEYTAVTRAKQDIYSNGQLIQPSGTSSRADKHAFKAEVLEKGFGNFQIKAYADQAQ